MKLYEIGFTLIFFQVFFPEIKVWSTILRAQTLSRVCKQQQIFHSFRSFLPSHRSHWPEINLKLAFKAVQSLLGIWVVQNIFILGRWIFKLHKIPSVSCFTIRLWFCLELKPWQVSNLIFWLGLTGFPSCTEEEIEILTGMRFFVPWLWPGMSSRKHSQIPLGFQFPLSFHLLWELQLKPTAPICSRAVCWHEILQHQAQSNFCLIFF